MRGRLAFRGGLQLAVYGGTSVVGMVVVCGQGGDETVVVRGKAGCFAMVVWLSTVRTGLERMAGLERSRVRKRTCAQDHRPRTTAYAHPDWLAARHVYPPGACCLSRNARASSLGNAAPAQSSREDLNEHETHQDTDGEPCEEEREHPSSS